MIGKKSLSAVMAGCGVLFSAGTAQALPLLQLDVQGGTYVGGTDQTTYANSQSFTLYALLNSLKSGSEYAISAAVVPKTSVSPLTQFGSFTINGVTYSSANGNMVFGTPPLDAEFDDIPGHGIFATHFAEVKFFFNSTHRMLGYNVEDQWMMDPEERFNASGSMLYQAFNIDISGLAAGYALHFDLYDPDYRNSKFAPFSHDAQSGTRPPTGGDEHPVPEGGATLLLLGTGLCALGAFRRRVKNS